MNPVLRRPRSLLVTGGCGFIGSALLRWLFGPGGFAGRVVVLDALTYAGSEENFVGAVDPTRCRTVRGDVAEPGLAARLCRSEGVEAILHLAAESHVDRSISQPARFLHTNVMGTQALLEVLRDSPAIHLHLVSTDEVYGPAAPGQSMDEAAPQRPSSPYSASKAGADLLALAYARTYGLSVTVSHGSNTYGSHQHPEKLIPAMLLRMLAGEPLPLYGDGEHRRCWLGVEDHVRGIWAALQRGRAGERYNLGGPDECSNQELVALLGELVGARCAEPPAAGPSQPVSVADRPGHDRRYSMDCTKARRDLGWSPSVRLREGGLARTVEWYLAQGPWLAEALARSDSALVAPAADRW